MYDINNSTCSSSVTQHPLHGTKMHPVMSKHQAHMALAAASQSHHHKLKLANHHKLEFSPPSHVISSYANFGPATSIPLRHTGFQNNAPFHYAHENYQQGYNANKVLEFSHYQQPKNQQQPNQQQILPSVHPSILTPFLEQVHLKQREVVAEQKNSQKHSHESNSHENNGSFEAVNDDFSKNLVPPPPSSSSLANFKSKPSNQPGKETKFNLSMPSPLQDISRFNYNNVMSTLNPTTPKSNNIYAKDNSKFKAEQADNTFLTTAKPNVFVNLNRTKENVYKQHKLLHPSYTGGLPNKKPNFNAEKPFLPTPYRPEKDQEEKPQIYDRYEPHHSFFTIEDAVTPHLPANFPVKSHISVYEEPEPITRPQYTAIKDYSLTIVPTREPSTAMSTTTTAVPLMEVSSQKPRQKLRRRRPKPQQIQYLNSEEQNRSSSRTRGNLRNNDTQNEIELRNRNSKNQPNRVRSRIHISSASETALSASDPFDAIVKFTEHQKTDTPTTQGTTERSTTTSLEPEESSQQQTEKVRHRVKLRYKNKLLTKSNSLEAANFKPKNNQISDSEHESVIEKQHLSDDTTEPYVVTESSYNEVKSSLRLSNQKLRYEVIQTTLPTTAETFSSSLLPSSSVDQEVNYNSNKIANRPRFSIKNYNRKQISSSTTTSSLPDISSTVSTITKPDSQRFNRLRLNLKRRNETSESGEEPHAKRRYLTRHTTTTTESPAQTTLGSATRARGILPKRIFPSRNFTKPTISLNEETRSQKPLKEQPTTPFLRQIIQNYQSKRKETSNADFIDPYDSIKIIDFSSESSSMAPESSTPSSTTESQHKHETAIMKIAKSSTSNANSIKSTTSNFINDQSENRNDFDLTGSPSDHSQRVAELTISGSDSHHFSNSANLNGLLSRRIPNFFTISTDDPILPIQAFFPQIKTNENVSLTN